MFNDKELEVRSILRLMTACAMAPDLVADFLMTQDLKKLQECRQSLERLCNNAADLAEKRLNVEQKCFTDKTRFLFN